MTIARLAWRNLLRAPRRTVLTMIAVIAGVGLFILGEGFLSGMTENIIASAIDGTVGHVLARPREYPPYPGQHPVDELLALSPQVGALLERRAVSWTRRTYFAPTAASGRDSLRAVAIGFDPKQDPLVFPRTHWRIEGVVPESGKKIAVSHRVARLLNLELGSPLILQVRTHQGAINALEVNVAAIVRTGNGVLDALGIFVPRDLTEELIASDLSSHLAVKLADRGDASAFAAELQAALGEQASVVTWEDETKELIALQQIRRRALDLIMLILMALAAFGIANTVLMAAYERVREIGTLRSMGMTEGGVLALFMLEGMLIGIIGGALGALWGGGLVAHWASSPIDFSEAVERSARDFSISALVYTRFDGRMIAATVALGVLVAIVASIYPARVASKMSPAEAVRAG